jgi:hypothetical protein
MEPAPFSTKSPFLLLVNSGQFNPVRCRRTTKKYPCCCDNSCASDIITHIIIHNIAFSIATKT